MSSASGGIANLSAEKKRALLAQLLRDKKNEPQAFPLSYSQQRLWFLDQLEPRNPTYNIPTAFRLKGRLNVPFLEKSVHEIQNRHKVLQTKFESIDGEPAQVIDPGMTTTLSIVDLQDQPESERESEAWRLLQQEIQQPFELSSSPLLRATLFQLSDTHFILLFTMHHIISDGWSLGIFTKELIEIYQALCKNGPPDLVDLPLQYSDFSSRQREWLEGKGLQRQLSYWKKQLAGVPPTLELPTDFPRGTAQTFEGNRQSIQLTNELSDALRKLSRDQGCTLFMVLLGVFKLMLYRYSGQVDISVGTPIANRDNDDIENLIGFFVNTLVLRTTLRGNPSFKEVLTEVREVTLSAYDNQGMPFEKLVEELQPERNLSRSPFFQVLFSIQNTPALPLELNDLTLEPLYAYNDKAKFDLSVYLWEKSDQLGGVFEYNTDIFKSGTITRMIGHFETLLESVVLNPDARISELVMLSAGERRQLLEEWNATEEGYPDTKCFHELFEAQVEKTPELPAVVLGSDRLTYEELNSRANQLAHHLKGLGVGPDVLVGICVERSVEMLVGLLGIMKAGCAYVPLDPSYPKERLGYMVEDSGLSILLSQEEVFAELVEPGESNTESHSPFSTLKSQNKVICLDHDWAKIGKESTSNPVTTAESTNLAYVIYTSGSTGRPKGVAIAHQTLVNFLASMRHAPGLTAADTLVAVTTLSFDIAGLELYLPLMVGSKVVLASREDASDGNRLSNLLTESGATVMQATPATWRMLLDSGWSGSSTLKMLCGGEALPAELANRLLDTKGPLWNMYGPTETTIWSSVYELESKESGVAVGPPVANTQIYILDKSGQPVPVGVYGELYIAGAGLARGYLNRAALTAEKFVPNPFSKASGARMYGTGDLARYLSDGRIELVGRIDHQVKIRGFRIELGEIEATLARHERIDEVVVVVRDDNTKASHLVAYLISQGESVPTVSELRRFVQGSLPEYMVPTSFVFLDSFPLTPNGKVDRKALPAPDGVRPELEEAFVAPSSPVEEVLVNVWKDIIGLKRIGVHDDFFELGGHSLLATRVISRVLKIFRIELPLRCVFEAPTIATFSAVLLENEPKAGWVDKVALTMKKIQDMSAEDRQQIMAKKRKEVA